ncbi:MAG: amidase [Candidatus Latescibacterota bacterium]|nr:amidase [Candidatus Latescibacterota bacterium]
MPRSDVTATVLADRMRRRDQSAVEVTRDHLTRIESTNPKVNAIVTLTADQALADAEAADIAVAKGEPTGPLHGLPVAHKDLVDTKDVRTTLGSPIFSHNTPDQDALIVERLKRAGAITVGKTNTPEFGAGSQTYNEVFGETLNPYDLGKTCGGSSGGAAVALACGMVPIADGSDLGGSLRNPAGFCNVTGFRPSPGRVPVWPNIAGWYPLSVQGPMARTVEDVALMLSALAGPDPRSPISIPEPGALFRLPLERDFTDVRIAWSQDLGGLPVDPVVTSTIEAQRHIFTDLGCYVIDGQPDFSGADEAFHVWRAWKFEMAFGDLLEEHRHQMKDTVIWNIEAGQKLTGMDVSRAEQKRTELYHRVREFQTDHEYLVCPVSQVPPFDIEKRYITEINGVQLDTYIDWMKSCYFISVTGCPAISVPCGFTDEGLPVGVQIVGRHRDDRGVLQLAYAFQQATEFWKHAPGICN